MEYSAQFAICLFLDGIFGDPRWYPHPVRGIGWVINRSELFFRKYFEDVGLAGVLTVFTVIVATGVSVFFLLFTVQQYSVHLETALAILLIYTAFSTKDLLVHSNAVHKALLSDRPLENGRKEVAQIVGRDTSQLSEEGVTQACVETVAENMVDGATSPVFFAVIASFFSPLVPLSAIACSAIGIFIYKAINTMDSMIGYKNEKYIDFGRVAARLDDVVNYIPARISGICLICSAFCLQLNWQNAINIYLRDHANHSSPNAAHPEAAVAGALGVRLGGPSMYFGEIVEKPYIGDALVSITPEHIQQANRQVVVAIVLFTLGALFAKHLISYLMT